jgi:hypothetical protein
MKLTITNDLIVNKVVVRDFTVPGNILDLQTVILTAANEKIFVFKQIHQNLIVVFFIS